MNTYDERQAEKQRWQRYRAAAMRLYPDASINPLCHVGENADKTCAFIEVTICVQRAEIEPRTYESAPWRWFRRFMGWCAFAVSLWL